MTARTAAALQRIFDALQERGCEPELTADGQSIVARCPCCDGDRALVVSVGAGQETEQ